MSRAITRALIFVHLSFTVNAWSAVAAGISTQPQWFAWADAPWLPVGEIRLETLDILPMQRRRLSQLGKMAASVASSASQNSDLRQLPIVWTSQYGDAYRSLEMLAQHVQRESISPTAFAISVHNGIGAQYSIAKSIPQNATSIAAGASTVEAGIIEAGSLLADGHPDVLVVHYDAPLPGAYATFHDYPMTQYAWAICIGRPSSGKSGESFSLTAVADHSSVTASEPALPPGLEVLKFLLSGAPRYHRSHLGRSWCWSRNDG